MSELIALDVALLLPPDIRQRAVELSAALPKEESEGLQLDEEHLPHITLTQQFVRRDELETLLDRVDETLRGQPPLTIHVTGGAKGGSVSMAIERTDVSLMLGPLGLAVWTTVAGLATSIILSAQFGMKMAAWADACEKNIEAWESRRRGGPG